MSVYEFGPFHLDAERLLLLEAGEPVALGPKVVETLLALIEHPGEVLAKNALLDRIWPEGYVDEANLAQNVYVLRKALRARWPVDAIETIPRRGYRFTAEVRRLQSVALAEPAFAVAPEPLAAAPARRRPRVWAALAAAAVLIAAITAASLTAARPHSVAARPSLSPAGERLYEIGRYYWNMRTRDGIHKSLEYFARVVDSDPRDARGYAALASANAIMADYHFGDARPEVYYARARAYARKALAIDPNSGEAYAVLGMISTSNDMSSGPQLASGVTQLRHAIELDPSDGPAHEWYGIALLSLGRIDQAYAQLQEAAQLDPLSVATTAWLGHAAYLSRHYEAAIGYARETLDLAPERYDVLGVEGLAYEARGDDTRAVEDFQRMEHSCADCRPEAAALLASAYARMKRFTEARAQIAFAQAHASDVEPQDLAIALLAVGERRVALSWLRRVRGSYLRAQIANDPRFDTLRDDPQVAALGLKPA